MPGGRFRWTAERGAATVEYGLIVSLIAVVAFVLTGVLGGEVFGLFDTAQLEIRLPGPLQPSS